MTDVSSLPFYDFMVDIETTGTLGSRHAMISLACVPFCWKTSRIGHRIFNQNLDMPSWRFWDEDTRNWWAKQAPSVFLAATENARPSAITPPPECG